MADTFDVDTVDHLHQKAALLDLALCGLASLAEHSAPVDLAGELRPLSELAMDVRELASHVKDARDTGLFVYHAGEPGPAGAPGATPDAPQEPASQDDAAFARAVAWMDRRHPGWTKDVPGILERAEAIKDAPAALDRWHLVLDDLYHSTTNTPGCGAT